MFDRTNPSKVVMQSISELIDKKIPKSEVLAQVKSKHPELLEDSIAKGIASFIPVSIKKKFRFHSYLLSLFVLIKIIFILIIPYQQKNDLSLIFLWSGRIIAVIIAIFFINGFLRFKLFYYTTAVTLYSLFLLSVIYNLIAYPISLILVISQIGTIVTFLFLYILRKQLFLNIDLWGNVLKENGIYKF